MGWIRPGQQQAAVRLGRKSDRVFDFARIANEFDSPAAASPGHCEPAF
jgi:hypothetical protein